MNNAKVCLSDAINLIQEVLDSGGEFLLSPKGTSMLPLLIQGEDRVVLKKYESVLPKKHDIVFYRRENGDFVLHRLMKIQKDGTYVMCGDNQLILEEGILPSQIIAYVSMIHKNARPLSLSSFRYRIYVWLWCFLPYRRFVMFSKRIYHSIQRNLFGKRS